MTYKKDNKRYQFTAECNKKDLSIFVYPLHVLTTNRICDTIISRQNQKGKWLRFPNDFNNIRSISGLMIGFTPYCISHFATCWDYNNYEQNDGLFIRKKAKGEQSLFYKVLRRISEEFTVKYVFGLMIFK